MFDSMGNSERMLDPQVSIKRALLFAEKENLRIECDSVGLTLKTSTCSIISPNGNRSTGRGKGLGHQSMASAIFESIEHYIYNTEDTASAISVKCLDLEGVDREFVGASPDFNLICSRAKIPLGRLRFSQLGNEKGEIFVPAVLMNPDYQSTDIDEGRAIADYRLRRYSTNSGTASGLNECEAILHALLEIVERDAVGLEMLKTVIHPKGFPVREIRLDSLPNSTKKTCDIAAAECMGQIVLWDITTDTNVPAILCALAIGNPVKFCFFGSGASLSASYAVERAILEAVQGYQIQNLYGSSFQHRMTRAVEKMSLYQRCNLDDGYFGYRWGKSVIDFSNIYSPIETLIQTEPKYQIQKIIEILQGLGINSYYRNLLSGEMYVVQVVAPRLERFYLVSHGIPVAPAARGRRVLASLER